MSSLNLKSQTIDFLSKIGIPSKNYNSSDLISYSPITGDDLGDMSLNSPEDMVAAIEKKTR